MIHEELDRELEVRLRATLDEMIPKLVASVPNIDHPLASSTTQVEVEVRRANRPKRSYVRPVAVAMAAAAAVAGFSIIINRPSPDGPASSDSLPVATAVTTAPSSDSLPVTTAETTAPSPSPVTVAVNNAAVRPTLLTSSNLPSGLTLEDGGTVTSAGPAEVQLVTPDNSVSHRILWQPADCSSAAIPPRTDALATVAAQQVSAGDQPIDPYVQWCDGPNVVTVYSTGSTLDGFVAFVSTVSATADSSSVTFIPPSGMQYRSELVTRTWSALSYRDGDRVILIKVTSAVDGEIPLSLAQVSDEQAIIVGRFKAHRTADQPSPQLLLVYDDNTIAFVSGENITDQELEDAAAALQPADAALAPPVSGNCETFGAMCG